MYVFLGVAHTKAFRYDKNTKTWHRAKGLHLFPGTVLYGEMTKEIITTHQEDDNKFEKFSLHVIDAIKLGDVSLMDLPFNERSTFVPKMAI